MSQRVLLDLFAGRFGWSSAFAMREWKCYGVDIVTPPEIPKGCDFHLVNVLALRIEEGIIQYPVFEDDVFCGNVKIRPDAIVASPPCQQFSVHGMKHFHPHPKYPENGIRLFNHTRNLCEAAGVPYVIENVRAAQQFVGNSVHHCGPFYLWGNAVPPLLPTGLSKGMSGMMGIVPKHMIQGKTKEEKAAARRYVWEKKDGTYTEAMKQRSAKAATVPPELANCVADYFERILERGVSRTGEG